MAHDLGQSCAIYVLVRLTLPAASGANVLLKKAAAEPAIAERWVSYWYSPGNVSRNIATLALLKKEGGSKVATSLQLYCEDGIREDGSFEAGVSPGCDEMIPQLIAVGIGAERIVGAARLARWRRRW